jgi:hypothetical protein
MTYAAADARQELLDTLAHAIDELAYALACLGEAYERLDEVNAERLEDGIFRAVQLGFGRAQRTHAEFAARHRLRAYVAEQASPVATSGGATAMIEQAVEAVGVASADLAELQDSPLMVDVGDQGLRAGPAGVREQVDGLPSRARELTRTLGR